MTDTIQSWRKVRQAESAADPIENDRVIKMAIRRFNDAGKPESFEVRTDTEYDDDNPSEAYRVYYFSPVASTFCESGLTALRATESEPPTANLPLVVPPDLLK